MYKITTRGSAVNLKIASKISASNRKVYLSLLSGQPKLLNFKAKSSNLETRRIEKITAIAASSTGLAIPPGIRVSRKGRPVRNKAFAGVGTPRKVSD